MSSRPSSIPSPAAQRDDVVRAWEANDYVDFMGAVLLGAALTMLALSVM